MYRGVIVAAVVLAGAISSWSEVFVADFNGDGKPDVLMTSSAAPEGIVVLLNQGEWDGKLTFRKTWPDVKSAGAAMPSHTPAAASPTTSAWPTSTGSSPSWTPTPTPAPVEPAEPSTPKAPAGIQPPPAPSLSTGSPKLRTSVPARVGSPIKADASKGEWKPQAAEPQPSKAWAPGGRKVALFNYKDKTAGSQFAWLERGIANILKFDVLEIKSVVLIDRERTDVTFDPAWVRDAGLAADLIITGEFEEAADRLIVTTWFLSSSMSAVREFKVEGDRADIFSLIEKVGARLKQELSALN